MESVDLAFADIGRVLTGRGFRLTDDIYNERDFGSRYVVYRAHNQDIRLTWDGKEKWLRLETGDAGKDVWRELKLVRIGEGTATPENIAVLKAALKELK